MLGAVRNKVREGSNVKNGDAAALESMELEAESPPETEKRLKPGWLGSEVKGVEQGCM